MYDLVIIGGGPAGITAGIYAIRQKTKTLLITKGFGGQMAWKTVNIENYPGINEVSGSDLVKKFEEHLRNYKIEIEEEEVEKIDKLNQSFSIVTKSQKNFQTKSIIIASGADPRLLKILGEKEFIGRGVSYCTICDAPFFSKKRVAVIGGGNSGFEAAFALAQYAEKIYIFEGKDKVCADLENQERIKKIDKIEIIINAEPKEIKGDKFVNSFIYFDKKSNKEKNLSLDGIFVEIGRSPAISFIKGLVELNSKNEIKINHFTNQTSCPGIFAAGDVSDTPFKQIIIAAGEGSKAAISAYYYLQK